jgi:hypothetical protein
MADQILPDNPTSHVIAGFFNMSQSCDMEQTALLPLRRKARCGFFRPKNPMASAGIDPAILGTRGQRANQWTTEAAAQALQLHKVMLSWDMTPPGFVERDQRLRKKLVPPFFSITHLSNCVTSHLNKN